MKNLYVFNKAALITTIILYLTIIFGLYAQIVLGGIQILSALGVSVLWNQLGNQYKKQLLIYWLLVISYAIGWLSRIELGGIGWVLGIIIIPMSIAIYFVWLLYNIKNNKYENSNS